MKFLKVLLYIAGGLIALLVVLGLFGKKTYHIERSIEINAPQAVVFDYVRDFNNFKVWSPWTALDPNQKNTVTGAAGEVGSKLTWVGNDNVGEGSQTITGMAAPNRIDIQTEFVRPFKSSSPTAFTFEEKDGKTKVSWMFDMTAPFPLNGLMMFTDVDKAVGKDYEMGLENLKRVVEEKAVTQ